MDMNEARREPPSEIVYQTHPYAPPARTFYLEPVDARPDSESGERTSPPPWRVLLSHPFLLLAFGVFGGLCGAVAFLQTPEYMAKATLEFQSDDLLNVRIGDFDPNSNAGNSGGNSPEANVETQVRVLSSAALHKRVAEKLHLKDVEHPPGIRARLLGMIGLAPPARAKKSPMMPVVTVKLQGATRIIEITCESPNAKLAADFANTLINEYIESTLESRWKSAQRTTEWLTRQLEELKVKLQNSEDQLQAYSRASGIVFTGKDTAEEEKLRKLEEELAKAQVDRASKQSARDVAESSAIDAVPQVFENSRVGEYEIKIADLRRELAELTAIYSPAHYKVKLVQAQIDELERTLKQEERNIVSRIRNEYEAARLRESMLQAAYDAQSKRVAAEAERAVNYNLLKHEVDTNRNLYDALLQRVKEAGIASAIRSSNARVVDSAEVPSAPFSPRPVRDCAMAFAMSIALGGALLIARERTNNNFREPGDTAPHLGVRELGAIPNAEIARTRGLTRGVLQRLNLKSNGSEQAPRVELIGWQDRHSVVAECFRATLASILYSAEDERRRPRVLMITSSLPGEGKTTSSSNLAIAVAETGCRTLLIDADMRNPKLHDVFSIPNSGGLSDLLRGQDAIENMPVSTMVRATAIPGLSLLPSGPGTASVWRLLHSPRMAALLRVFRSEFDLVLIDSPPVLQCTDARVLARYSDGVILVLHAGRTTRDAVMACRKRFAEDRIPVLGTILNRWRPHGRMATYYGTYQPGQETGAA